MSELETLRRELQKFRELYEETLRRQGAPRAGAGIDGLAEIKALEAVLAGERPFRGSLIRPLSGFANMLCSGSLPPTFQRMTFGDLCVALGQALESRGTGRWRFDPDLDPRTAEQLGVDRAGKGLDDTQRDNETGWRGHAAENARFVSRAISRAPARGTIVVVGAARSHDLPLAEIADLFERVIVVDVGDPADTRANVGRVIRSPAALQRISVERFDLTGSYNQFSSTVGAIVSRAANEDEAERELDDLASGYDVPALAVRLCRAEVDPDVVVSSMVLTQLGLPFTPLVTAAFRARGFRGERIRDGILGESLAALAARVEQHHVAALLQIPKVAVLTSDVRETVVAYGPGRDLVAMGPPRLQLGVQHLTDRIPTRVKPLEAAAWKWLRVVPRSSGAPGASMDVEGVVLGRPSGAG